MGLFSLKTIICNRGKINFDDTKKNTEKVPEEEAVLEKPLNQ